MRFRWTFEVNILNSDWILDICLAPERLSDGVFHKELQQREGMLFGFASSENELLEDRNDWREVFEGSFGIFVAEFEDNFVESL